MGSYNYSGGSSGFWETATNVTTVANVVNNYPVAQPYGGYFTPAPVATTPLRTFGNPETESEALIEAYFAGYAQSFTHPGGPIGLYPLDAVTSDNINGSVRTTWSLATGLGPNSITLSWRYIPCFSGGAGGVGT